MLVASSVVVDLVGDSKHDGLFKGLFTDQREGSEGLNNQQMDQMELDN